MNSQPISLIRGHDSVVPVRIELVAEADGALVATSFIGTWAQPTTPEP